MHYFTASKPYPRGADGLLEANFRREWVKALNMPLSDLHLNDDQHLDTWKQEWPRLLDVEKKKAMLNLWNTFGGKRKSPDNMGKHEPILARLDDYMSVFTSEDTLNFQEALMNSMVGERTTQNYLIPTLTFVAHLTQWTREHQPSVLAQSVAMLSSWPVLTQAPLYRDYDSWSQDWTALATALPNTSLLNTIAVSGSSSGDPALLNILLSDPNCEMDILWETTVSALETTKAIGRMYSFLTPHDNLVFQQNAKHLGERVLHHHDLERQTTKKSSNKDLHSFEYNMLSAMVGLGVSCQNSTLALILHNGAHWPMHQFWDFLETWSSQWSTSQHQQMIDVWRAKDGYFLQEDLFGSKTSIGLILEALPKLPVEWAQWFEERHCQEFERFGPVFLSEQPRLDIHHWFHENVPAVYERWIQGTAANAALLNDPVVGETAWRCTQAGSPHFLMKTTVDWLSAYELNFDIRHAAYPLAKMAWARQGVDLESSLCEALQDTSACYPALALEAISPGQGKNRWAALRCLVDDLEHSEGWCNNALAAEAIRACVEERLNPQSNALVIDNASSLFQSSE